MTEELQQLLSGCTTLSIANSAATELWLLQQHGFGGVDMDSPYRQACHIFGLALATQERPNAKAMAEKQWQRAKTLSSKIFDQYGLMYFANPAEMRSKSEDERKRIYVTMCMFLQYLGSPVMRSGDQWENRLKALYVPFDDFLRKRLGFSATDYLRLTDCIRRGHKAQFKRYALAKQKAEELHKAFMTLWEAEGWSVERMRLEVDRHPFGQALREYLEAGRNLWIHNRSDLTKEVGLEVVGPMLSALGTERGLSRNKYDYATDPSPAVRFPLLMLGEDQCFCATYSLFYQAAELHFNPVVASGEIGRRFFEIRDAWVEQRVAAALREFLGEEGRVWQSVCEDADGQFEHDVLVQFENVWIVGEAKGSPVRRGLFDPERAYVRIRDDFLSEKGVQKAYEQGERLRQRLLSGRVRLFDEQGNILVDTGAAAQEVFVVCVTGEFWGLVAIDLSLLLEKPANVPYPWAVSIDDFETLLGGLKARGKGIRSFVDFLRQRSRLHGHVFSEDELNIGGYFLEKGLLPAPPSDPKESFLFTPENSTIFDEIFYEKHGTPVKRDREEELQKYLTGVRDTSRLVTEHLGLGQGLDRGSTLSAIVPGRQKKIGRNSPCPCGSGLKYKKCCGRRDGGD